MSKYYRTSSAAPIDYMYETNTPLMERSLMANDKYITQAKADDNTIQQAANFNYIDKDAEAASKIIGDYTTQTEYIANQIAKDPANYRRQNTAISDLKKKLVTDYTTGAISKYVGNYNQRKQNIDELNKQVDLYSKSGGKDKDGNEVGVSPERAAAYQAYWDDSFKGTNYDPNNPHNYGRYAPAKVMTNINVQKRLSQGFDKLKADGTVKTRTSLTGNEEYFNDQTSKWEGLTPTKILGLVTDHFRGDQQLQEYLREDSKVGAARNIYYPQDVKDPRTGSIVHRAGELIDPYSIEARGISPDEQHQIDTMKMEIDKVKNPTVREQMKESLQNHVEQLKGATDVRWNAESGLAPVFRGIVDQYSYSKTSEESKLRGGTNWGTRFSQAQQNFRQGRQLTTQMTIAANVDKRMRDLAHLLDEDRDRDFDFKKDTELWKRENYYPKAPGTGKTATGAKPAATNLPVAPTETSVASLSTNSFAGITTKDINGGTVPMLSTDGLVGDIVSFKNQLNDVNTKIAANNKISNSTTSTDNQKALAKAENENLLAQQNQLNSNLGLRRDWYAKATNAALSNGPYTGEPIAKEDVDLYHEFSNDVQGIKFKQHIAEVEKHHPKVLLDQGLVAQVNKEKAELTQAQKELSQVGADSRYTIDTRTPLKEKITRLERSIALSEQKGIKVDSPEVKAEKLKLAKYYDANNRITKKRDTFLDQLRKDNIDSDAIIPTSTESSQIMDMVLSTPDNLQLFDNGGNPTANVTLQSRGDWWLTGKKWGGDFSGGLADFIKVHDVKVSVNRIAPSTKLGNGDGVMEVQFDDPTHTLSTKPFYVALTPSLTQRIATKYSSSKNPLVNKIAANLADDEATNIRRQMTQPKINNLIGSRDAEQSFDIITTANNGARAPLHVTKFPSSNQVMVTMTDPETNQQIPFPFGDNTPASGIPGMFSSADDFISHFKDIKKNGKKQN